METKVKREWEHIPVEHEDIDKFLAAIRFLIVHKIPYADKTPFGGALWVFITDPTSKQMADLIATSGVKFIFTEKGGAASHNQPAWYHRPSGNPKKNKRVEIPSNPDSTTVEFVLEQPQSPQINRQTANEEWIWSSVDENSVKRALRISNDSIHMDEAKKEASIDGSPDRKTGEISTHVVTLTRCSCQDFNINNKREKPCKHIIRLGMELGIINNNGLTPEQQREKDIIEFKDKIARAAGYYYIFKSPICADNMYDRMKERLAYLERERY